MDIRGERVCRDVRLEVREEFLVGKKEEGVQERGDRCRNPVRNQERMYVVSREYVREDRSPKPGVTGSISRREAGDDEGGGTR